jgi:hypothetical protein
MQELLPRQRAIPNTIGHKIAWKVRPKTRINSSRCGGLPRGESALRLYGSILYLYAMF